MTPYALAQSAPTKRPCFPSVRGRSLCVAFSHVRDRHIYFQQFRADQNLFDLIPADSGFLTVAKSHTIFSQYCENNYSVIRKFATNSSCPRAFLCLNGDVSFLSFLVYGLLKRRHAG